ncbi:MAG: FAD-dependent oxidoreductase, partial [Deltaproteobacteria bacterium]|nr:FAD-dependent oxidoreductase [Deltaproteobacteria bacterium]
CWTPWLIPSNPAIAMWATEESVFHVDANRELPIFNDARLFSYLGALNGGFSATLETRKHIRIIERTGGTKILPGVRSYRAREDAQIRCGQFLTALFPEVGWTIRSSTCCYEWTSDYKPIVGRVSGREHVWVCSSFTGGGFKLGPLLGDYMAQSVTSNEVHEGLAAFDPNRG